MISWVVSPTLEPLSINTFTWFTHRGISLDRQHASPHHEQVLVSPVDVCEKDYYYLAKLNSILSFFFY
jgi:hypothetical protein